MLVGHVRFLSQKSPNDARRTKIELTDTVRSLSTSNMKNKLIFKVPFSGFCGTTFINCFASTYVFLENITVGRSDYECKQLDGKSFDSCGNTPI
jgi:hypothetical protein